MRQQKPPVYPPIGPQSHGQSRGPVTLLSPSCNLDPIRCLPDLAMQRRKRERRVAVLAEYLLWDLAVLGLHSYTVLARMSPPRPPVRGDSF